MPTYRFLNKETGEEFEEFMTISSLDKYKEENPHLEQRVNGAPLIGDPMRLGRQKPDSRFREMLRNIQKKNPGSSINSF